MVDKRTKSAGRNRLSRWILGKAISFTKNRAQKPRGFFGRILDSFLRRYLFQSKREGTETKRLSAIALIGQLIIAVYDRFMTHSILSVAASSAFFVVLAIFPGLAGLVALYGLLGDPADITTFVSSMPNIIPPDVVLFIKSFLNELISRSYTNLTTLILAFGIALWTTNSAMKSLVESLNIVYERQETRSIVQLNILGTWMTLTFLGFMLISVNIMILPVWDWLLNAFQGDLIRLRWLVLLFAVQTLISALYYFAPCGRQRRWHIMTAGASIAAIAWVVMSMLFSLYLTNFANYSVTYGSLGAAAIFMTWLWLTVTVLLTGAEIDAAIADLGVQDKADLPAAVNTAPE